MARQFQNGHHPGKLLEAGAYLDRIRDARNSYYSIGKHLLDGVQTRMSTVTLRSTPSLGFEPPASGR